MSSVDAPLEILARQWPALALSAMMLILFIGVIWKMLAAFLKYIRDRDEQAERRDNECHIVQRESVAALRDNAATIARASEIIERAVRQIEKSEAA